MSDYDGPRARSEPETCRFQTASRRLAAWLEQGSSNSALGVLSRVWSELADPVRPLRWPSGARLLGLGGATLGGSYKSPTAAALATALKESGLAPAVVAPRYTARGRTPRVARGDWRSDGDDAVLLARALAPLGVSVVVGRNREASVALAARVAPIVLLDGVLQTRPRPLACSVLVLDADAPFGAGRCVPAGDLRASPDRLLAAADLVLLVGQRCFENPLRALDAALGGRAGKLDVPGYVAESRLAGAREVTTPWVAGRRHNIEELRSLSVGVLMAVARPERVLHALARRGIRPRCTWLVRDHSGFGGRPPARCPGIDVWLTTAKCWSKLPPSLGPTPIWVLDHQMCLPRAFVDAVIGRLTC